MKPLALAFVGLLLACGGRKESLPDGGSLSGPITFRIGFNTSHGNTMFLQTGREQEWLEVRDSHGAALPIASSCACVCESCSACGVCPVRKGNLVQVPQFGSTTFQWSGFVFPKNGSCSGHDCVAKTSANPGKFTAHYCWGTAFLSDPDGSKTVSPTTCGDQSFDYPSPDGGSVDIDVCDC